jgi:hypothetical protein
MPLGPNAGYRLYTTGDVLTAAQVQNNLQNQTIMFFASAAARDANTALTAALTEGMFCYLANTDGFEFYNGTTWVPIVSGGGDLTAINAGAGITVTDGTGPVPTISLASSPTFTSPKEVIAITASAATGTVNANVVGNSQLFYTLAATGNWTLNVRGNSFTTLDSIMSTGESMNVIFEATQGSPAYYATGFTIDGAAPASIQWLGGTAPSSGNANGVDIYMYQIIKTGTATFRVFASQNRFA